MPKPTDPQVQAVFHGEYNPTELRCQCGETVTRTSDEHPVAIVNAARRHAKEAHGTTACRFERAPYVRWSSMSGGPSFAGRSSRTHMGSLVYNGERFSVWISRKSTDDPWDCSVFANDISEPTAETVTVLEAEFDTLEQARQTASNIILRSIGWKQ